MPVQPMKAIAAIAIADDHFNLPEVLAAGIFVGGVMFVLGVTSAIDSFHRYMQPRSPAPAVPFTCLSAVGCIIPINHK